MIYFDNAATSFPKPREVEAAMLQSLSRYGANPGRSGHRLSLDTAIKIYECRETAARFFGAAQPEHVVFTQNCTHALNLALKGFLQPGDHVILSDLEHNSLLRPVHALSQQGLITYSIAPVGENDTETIAAFAQLIRPETRLIACTHGSNVWGFSLPLQALGALAHSHGALLLADCAQTAGVLPIDMARDNIDFLCTAGHKSLCGPTGTGLLITALGQQLRPLLEGGTGTNSLELDQPYTMPERLESGTINTMGIIGLQAGIKWVQRQGLNRLHNQEMELTRLIAHSLAHMKHIQLYTLPPDTGHRLPVLSFTMAGNPSEKVVNALSDRGFALRGGLHCAPLAHRKMGTWQSGAARISVGAFNTRQQARQLCDAIAKLTR